MAYQDFPLGSDNLSFFFGSSNSRSIFLAWLGLVFYFENCAPFDKYKIVSVVN